MDLTSHLLQSLATIREGQIQAAAMMQHHGETMREMAEILRDIAKAQGDLAATMKQQKGCSLPDKPEPSHQSSQERSQEKSPLPLLPIGKDVVQWITAGALLLYVVKGGTDIGPLLKALGM